MWWWNIACKITTSNEHWNETNVVLNTQNSHTFQPFLLERVAKYPEHDTFHLKYKIVFINKRQQITSNSDLNEIIHFQYLYCFQFHNDSYLICWHWTWYCNCCSSRALSFKSHQSDIIYELDMDIGNKFYNFHTTHGCINRVLKRKSQKDTHFCIVLVVLQVQYGNEM